MYAIIAMHTCISTTLSFSRERTEQSLKI